MVLATMVEGPSNQSDIFYIFRILNFQEWFCVVLMIETGLKGCDYEIDCNVSVDYRPVEVLVVSVWYDQVVSCFKSASSIFD